MSTPALPPSSTTPPFYRCPSGSSAVCRCLLPLPTVAAYRRCHQLPWRRVAGRPSRQIASASRRLGVAYGEGSEWPRRSFRPPPGAAVEPPWSRRLPSAPAAFVRETMNSEVGTGSADFTYIKKALCFKVGTRNADFETAKVGIRSADFKYEFIFVSRWKSAYGMPTSFSFRTTSFGSRHVDCRLPHSGSR